MSDEKKKSDTKLGVNDIRILRFLLLMVTLVLLGLFTLVLGQVVSLFHILNEMDAI